MAEVRPIPVSRYLSLGSDRVVAQVFWIATMAMLTAIGAQLEIPHQPVPYTFQTFFVILTGGLLGRRNAFVSMALYLVMGVAGLPVFAGAGFGLAKLLGPTGGYLLSFPIAAYIIGYLASLQQKSADQTPNGLKKWIITYGWTLSSMTLGLLIVFSLGTLQLNTVYFHNWQSSIQSGFLIFSWWDILKLASAAVICTELRRM